jgi:glycerol-3-phosphate dehydrogenase
MEKAQEALAMKGLDENWDVVVTGGGITGAGIFRETVRMGLKVLLVEQQDFAWGTSSRSSKLVHGGLRYLKEGQFHMTKVAIRERDRLMKEAPGLVEPLGFLFPVYKGRGLGKWTLSLGLWIYDFFEKRRQHRFYDVRELVKLLPAINQQDLLGGFHFFDAEADDARLVLRLIHEAIRSGGHALNYTALTGVKRNDRGYVSGVTVEDTETHEKKELQTGVLFNATGCWAERLHPSPEKKLHMRPLRGSHLIFPARLLPLDQAVSFSHPSDERSVYLVPWEGAVIVGTTDLDHEEDLSMEPAITEGEVSYLMEALHTILPSINISRKDCLSTIAGVRPVLSKRKADPSHESREHVVWVERGLVTVTGGKLTTFRQLAFDALKAARPYLGNAKLPNHDEPIFDRPSETPEEDFELAPDSWRTLCGRYGELARELVRDAGPQELEVVSGTRTLWAELPYAAQYENIRHLTDLLLRRVRIGLLTPEGGREHFGRIRSLVAPVVSWDDKRWKDEIRDYLDHWRHAHSVPSVKDSETS